MVVTALGAATHIQERWYLFTLYDTSTQCTVDLYSLIAKTLAMLRPRTALALSCLRLNLSTPVLILFTCTSEGVWSQTTPGAATLALSTSMSASNTWMVCNVATTCANPSRLYVSTFLSKSGLGSPSLSLRLFPPSHV